MSDARDFWLSCGHHLLDRDEGGGLLVTDEFLKAYLARPEITPPAEACAAERNEPERVKALKEVVRLDPGNRRAQSALSDISAKAGR